MVKKKTLLGFCLLVLVVISFVSCKQQDSYHWKTQASEDILSLFRKEPYLFDEVVNVVRTNERFWQEARRDEEATHAQISSPNDEKTMSLFTQEEQDILRSFFEQTGPYQISLTNQAYITITYINQDQTGDFTLAYYFDKTTVDFYGNNNYREWASGMEDSHQKFVDLGEDWVFYE